MLLQQRKNEGKVRRQSAKVIIDNFNSKSDTDSSKTVKNFLYFL